MQGRCSGQTPCHWGGGEGDLRVDVARVGDGLGREERKEVADGGRRGREPLRRHTSVIGWKGSNGVVVD